MRKIPTLFRRDPDDMRRVLPEVHPDCQWVLDGEGVATRKYDGTCVMFDGSEWWARREVKPGKSPPANFVLVDHDESTGKTVGWEPVEQTGWTKYLNEAIAEAMPGALKPGTYELCGPKVNGNPERFPNHWLIRHADAHAPADLARYVADLTAAEAHSRLASWLAEARTVYGWEGIVWHHPDGRMAKLKARDFPRVPSDA